MYTKTIAHGVFADGAEHVVLLVVSYGGTGQRSGDEWALQLADLRRLNFVSRLHKAVC